MTERETGRPLEGVAVTLSPLPDSDGVRPAASQAVRSVTDRAGRFFVPHLADGTYRIVIESIGYRTIVDSLAFRTKLGLHVAAELVPEAVELEPLLVVAEVRSRRLEANGFYDRRRQGLGRFVTRDQIQERHYVRVSDILRGMSGVRIAMGGGFPSESRVLLRGGCVPDVYLDGVRTLPPFPMDAMLRPFDLDAVEVYHSSEVPAQFGAASCGAIVLWTHVPNPGTGGSPLTWGRALGLLGFLGAVLLLTR